MTTDNIPEQPIKLIEKALPINILGENGEREKSQGKGHSATLHRWWARRPLGVVRALLFAQLVDDPSNTNADAAQAAVARADLLDLTARLSEWRTKSHKPNPNDPNKYAAFSDDEAIAEARTRIAACYPAGVPAVYDPFLGSGSTVLEARRLGLPAYGNDLNPVAVMVGLITADIPFRFFARPAINPAERTQPGHRLRGLISDVDYYGKRLRTLAMERLQSAYPPLELDGQSYEVVAWLWTRTVPSPDPRFREHHTPLHSTYVIGKKETRKAWVEPQVDRATNTIDYILRTSTNKTADYKLAEKGNSLKSGKFRCLHSGLVVGSTHIRNMAQQGRMRTRMYAVVGNGKGGRVFGLPTPAHLAAAETARPAIDDINIPEKALSYNVHHYGYTTYGSLYADRQLHALTTLCDLIAEIGLEIAADCRAAGWAEDPTPLCAGGAGQTAYVEALQVYLGILVSKLADYHNALCRWKLADERPVSTFNRQALAMVWDYAEANMLGASAGSLTSILDGIVRSLAPLEHDHAVAPCHISHGNAIDYVPDTPGGRMIHTDPPYYDNIGYADLSDFFYLWHRRLFRDFYPELYFTRATPKAEELIVTPHRHANKAAAEDFYMDGMRAAIARMVANNDNLAPAVIYYAFKQSEMKAEGIEARGWATFLRAIIESGYVVSATWPVRTETKGRAVAIGTNALATSMILICRKRASDARYIGRHHFEQMLHKELAAARIRFDEARIPPTDLPQSAIGIGIGVFSKYRGIRRDDDSCIEHAEISTVLRMITKAWAEVLDDQLTLDPPSRIAFEWYKTHQFAKGTFGEVESLARVAGVPVEALGQMQIAHTQGGEFTLYRPQELYDLHMAGHYGTSKHAPYGTVWGACLLLSTMILAQGLKENAELALYCEAALNDNGFALEAVRNFADAMYNTTDQHMRKPNEARPYNELATSWRELEDKIKAAQDDPQGNMV